jgi:NADH-quinone oxidoreductase subunit J
MDFQMAIFLVLAAVGVISAVLVISQRNLVHSALYLVVTFFTVAAMYVLLHAEFIAVVQILVYTGGIMVLFLFVILLVDVPREQEQRRLRAGHAFLAAILTTLALAPVALYAWRGSVRSSGETAALVAEGGNLETAALELFRYYLLPFEVISILLLVALVGAVVLARSEV